MTRRVDAEHTIATDRITSLEHAAKVITEEIAGIAGETVAECFGICRTTLANKLVVMPFATRKERERRPHVAAGEIARLPLLAAESGAGLKAMLRIVSRLYLEPNGYAAVKLPEATKSASNLELVSNMHRESSEATGAALAALSKGYMDRGLALSAIKEARESIAVSLEVIAIAESALREGVVAFREVAS